MRKSLHFLIYMLFATPLLLSSSCGIEDVEAEDGAIVFELYDAEGNLIEGLQSMRFGIMNKVDEAIRISFELHT